MKPWVEKAHRIVSKLCAESYRQANQLPNGRYRRKHVPYTVPVEAEYLIDCLNRDDEESAKAFFIRQAILGD